MQLHLFIIIKLLLSRNVNVNGYMKKILEKDSIISQKSHDKKIMKKLKIVESKIIPGVYIFFTTIYWAYGCYLYFY